jgi:apolipoprotein N-acyltransferase
MVAVLTDEYPNNDQKGTQWSRSCKVKTGFRYAFGRGEMPSALAFVAGLGKLAGLNALLEKNISRWFLAIIAGLLLAAAFPRIDFAGGAWVAPGLLVFAAWNRSGREVFRLGMAAGFLFWLVSLYWLLEIPFRWHSIPLGPGAGWLALSAFVALFPATWLWLIVDRKYWVMSSWPGRLGWALGGAAAWVGLEMIRARIFGGFPWNILGASQFKMVPLIQIASVTGVYGVSFLVVWTSLSLYSAARMFFLNPSSRFVWQEVFLPLLVVAVLFAWGEFKAIEPAPTTTTLRVALIQPSIPQNLIWDESANSVRFQQLIQLSESALSNKVDLLVWPESAVPEFDDATYSAITNLAYTHHIWLIFNADDVLPNESGGTKYDVFNAAFLFGPDGAFREVYHKQKLVIFGEYIPLSWLPIVKWLTPIPDSYKAGDSPKLFPLDNFQVSASPLICFEDLFPQVGRQAAGEGADFLVNLTNDGWFGQSAEQWQHEIGAIFRAVENGVPLLRCCNNGITCWVDAKGHEREIFQDKNGGVYGPGVMIFDLPLQKNEPTFYTRHGDWFGWGCVGIALIFLGFKVAAFKNRPQEGK